MAYVAMYNPQPNSGYSTCGLGLTKEEAERNRSAYNNQQPLKTVPFSRAPHWARKEAIRSFYAPCRACGKTHPAADKHMVCVDSDGNPLPVTRAWGVIAPEYDGETVSAADRFGALALAEFKATGYPTSV